MAQSAGCPSILPMMQVGLAWLAFHWPHTMVISLPRSQIVNGIAAAFSFSHSTGRNLNLYRRQPGPNLPLSQTGLTRRAERRGGEERGERRRERERKGKLPATKDPGKQLAIPVSFFAHITLSSSSSFSHLILKETFLSFFSSSRRAQI